MSCSLVLLPFRERVEEGSESLKCLSMLFASTFGKKEVTDELGRDFLLERRSTMAKLRSKIS